MRIEAVPIALGQVLPGMVESLAFAARKKELALDKPVLHA